VGPVCNPKHVPDVVDKLWCCFFPCSRHLNSLTLARHTQLLEILEISQVSLMIAVALRFNVIALSTIGLYQSALI